MRHEIQLVGIGGQGVRLASTILSRACGIYDGKNVAETHLYGAEARGGLSESELVMSDGDIYYVKVQNPDYLIALSQFAYDEYSHQVKDEGTIIADDFYIESYDVNDTRLKLFPLTRIALDVVGSKIAVNVVSLGVLSALDSFLNPESMRKAVEDLIKERFVEKNLIAFDKGFEIGERG